jgi:hypothetical protein
LFGWANGGYTWSSSGAGQLRIEPHMNRFGDAWLLIKLRSSWSERRASISNWAGNPHPSVIRIWILTVVQSGLKTPMARVPARAVILATHMLNFRPEVRWDTASNPAFGSVSASHLKSHQWSCAFETLVQF